MDSSDRGDTTRHTRDNQGRTKQHRLAFSALVQHNRTSRRFARQGSETRTRRTKTARTLSLVSVHRSKNRIGKAHSICIVVNVDGEGTEERTSGEVHAIGKCVTARNCNLCGEYGHVQCPQKCACWICGDWNHRAAHCTYNMVKFKERRVREVVGKSSPVVLHLEH